MYCTYHFHIHSLSLWILIPFKDTNKKSEINSWSQGFLKPEFFVTNSQRILWYKKELFLYSNNYKQESVYLVCMYEETTIPPENDWFNKIKKKLIKMLITNRKLIFILVSKIRKKTQSTVQKNHIRKRENIG